MFAKLKRPVVLAGGLVVAIAVGAAAYLAFLQRLEDARRLHQAKDILVASRLYAVAHAGEMPRTFEDLAGLTKPDGVQRYYMLADGTRPFLDRAARELEILTPGIPALVDPRTPFLRERQPDKKGRWVIGFVDASAIFTDRSPARNATDARFPFNPNAPAGDFMTPLEQSRATPH